MIYTTRADYRSAWANATHEDPPVPLNIDIELASICNLACPFCFYGEADWNAEMRQTAADGKPKKRFMPKEMAHQIIVQAESIGVPALKMNWRGESTLHPDYSEILNHAYRKDYDGIFKSGAFHEILVNTNANCKPEAIAGLMCATKVMVSLDSTIVDTYKKMRKNGDLDTALHTIRTLLKNGHENVWVRRVITKDNATEPFAQNVRQLFGPKVKIAEHFCFDRNADEHHQVNDPRFERTYCGYPSQRMMIASDGTVYPCCVDTDATMPMGKFPEQSLLEIWNGEPFKKLRAELRANVFKSGICQNCESWMAYKAPEREKVQDVEVIPIMP